MCKSYDCSPYTAGLLTATDSTAVKSGGWEVVSLSNQLESVNNRPMGSRDSERVSDSFQQSTSPGSLAKPNYVLSRAKPADSRGSNHPDREGCGYSGTQPSTSRQFLLHSLLGPQERGPDEASNKSQEAERVGDTSALQDGRHGDTQRIAENERLDGEGRLKRCLLHNPNTPQSSTIPEIHGGTKALPVHMPAIRPVLCPVGFHQGDEASSHLSSQYGSAHDSIHRRYTTDGRLPKSSGELP